MKYLVLLIGLLALSIFYIQFASRYGIVDKPNNRSSHSNETIRGGGIIFPVSALSWFIYAGFQFPLFFTGLIIIGTISFWDDLSQVSPKLRLMVHMGALLLLFAEIPNIRDQFPWWSWVPVLILSTWIINAYNFMDGINGITGGYSLAVLTGIWIVNNYQIEFISNELIYFLVISIVVFTWFNFRTTAKCFAGDVGSISIAYIIVFLLAKLIIQSGNWIYILFLSLYGVDTGFTIIHRIIQKENIFMAHRKHLYQLLTHELKFSHLKVAALYTIVQLMICLIIIMVSVKHKTNLSNLITGASILGIMAFIFHWIKYLINGKVIRL